MRQSSVFSRETGRGCVSISSAQPEEGPEPAEERLVLTYAFPSPPKLPDGAFSFYGTNDIVNQKMFHVSVNKDKDGYVLGSICYFLFCFEGSDVVGLVLLLVFVLRPPISIPRRALITSTCGVLPGPSS